ncbi:murein biosynthesis integral membrane protein MurJ [Cellulomonas iranensis]|uniref:Peptidoglycan lipid II flippase n=2 Tax=Cellulomonas iranensis TaxID=76862 RepID=A0ABU0GIY5_9CELL|nr:murein biosynthesis integral membrane protein MurJ [Cellulomonas iranensis]MDQ0425342.1 putative peptidoglycan lipid II flippase [Cellulomonas iranensis]
MTATPPPRDPATPGDPGDVPDEAPQGGLRRGAALMASGTAVSRLLGFLRAMVLAAAIGATGQAADAFSVANKLPNVLYMLLAGGVLNAVLVPQVVRAYKRDGGQEYVDRLLSFGFALLAGVSVVLTLAAPLLVRLYADPCSTTQLALATTFAYWCIPQLFFYGVYALLGQVLNARGSFGPYMWAPVVNNLVSIAGFGVFMAVFGGASADVTWGTPQIAVFAGSATLGVVAQALVLVPALRRAGVGYRWRWGLRGSGLGRAGKVATWTFIGLAIGQLGYVVVSRVASAAPGAACVATSDIAGNAAYDYAFMLFMLPHSLVTVSLATALFTRLSARAHDGDVAGVRADLSTGLRVVGLFTLIAGAGLTVLARPVVRLILVSSSEAAVSAVAGVVVAMAVGLPAFGAWSMCQRVYYAYEDAKGMVPVQAAMAGVVVAGTLLGQAVLPHSAWVAGAGLSMSASYLLGTLMAMRALRRRLGGDVDGAHVLRTHARAGLATVAAAAVGVAVLLVVQVVGPGGVVGALVQCAVVGTVMVLVYVGGLKLLRVRELDQLVGPLVRRLRGRR